MRIPYVDLPAQHRPLRERLLAAVERVLDHGQFILGPEVEMFERRVAQWLGVEHVVGVNSGTDALYLALRLRDIGPGAEVITVSHSFVATATAIELRGARPVFVDLDERTMLLDPARLEAALTPKTRAVMPVHLNGYPCDLAPIAAFCERHGLALIEDCAQSLGARYRGRATGSFGVGCFSLHPLKVLSACGDGGFLTVASAEDAARLREWRNIGLRDRDHCRWVSGNSRLDTLQAAMLLVKLDSLEGWLAARRDHAAAYRAALAGRFVLPPEDAHIEPVWSAFVVRHERRDAIAAAMRQRGIDLKSHYPIAIHQQEAFTHHRGASLPVTERVVREILSLPVTPELDEAGRAEVIAALLETLSGMAA